MQDLDPTLAALLRRWVCHPWQAPDPVIDRMLELGMDEQAEWFRGLEAACDFQAMPRRARQRHLKMLRAIMEPIMGKHGEKLLKCLMAAKTESLEELPF